LRSLICQPLLNGHYEKAADFISTHREQLNMKNFKSSFIVTLLCFSQLSCETEDPIDNGPCGIIVYAEVTIDGTTSCFNDVAVSYYAENTPNAFMLLQLTQDRFNAPKLFMEAYFSLPVAGKQYDVAYPLKDGEFGADDFTAGSFTLKDRSSGHFAEFNMKTKSSSNISGYISSTYGQ
jgi:hypothetical protein